MTTVILLTISNVFMTFAWYGHLKYRDVPLFKVILVSWLIAFLEYCFQVPANRIGSYEFTAVQLKTIQEVITLDCVLGFLRLVFARRTEMELPRGIRAAGGCRMRDFQEMVVRIWEPNRWPAIVPHSDLAARHLYLPVCRP